MAVIVLAGTIGAGKSSLTALIANRLGITFILCGTGKVRIFITNLFFK